MAHVVQIFSVPAYTVGFIRAPASDVTFLHGHGAAKETFSVLDFQHKKNKTNVALLF